VWQPQRHKRLHAVPLPFTIYSHMLAETRLGSVTLLRLSPVSTRPSSQALAEKAISAGVWSAQVPAPLRPSSHRALMLCSDVPL
jgi:hypothetical protein